MPNYNCHLSLVVSGQLVKLLNPEKPFFGTVILTTAVGFTGWKLTWLGDKPSTARISGLEVPQTSGFCFQVSRTGSVAPPVGLGWEVVKPGGTTRFLPDYWAGPLDSTCELLEIKSANLILSILLQPRQRRLGLSGIPSCFLGIALIKHLHKTSAVKSLTVTGELDENGIFPNKISEWQKCHLCHVWFIVFIYLMLKCHCLKVGKLLLWPHLLALCATHLLKKIKVILQN